MIIFARAKQLIAQRGATKLAGSNNKLLNTKYVTGDNI
jgi:hypothetical protein